MTFTIMNFNGTFQCNFLQITFYIVQNYILMKFLIVFNKTPLYKAVENENVEMVKLLLSNPQIDVNIYFIFD